MKELLTYIARNLVENPDAVSVSEYALMRSVAQRQGKRVSVEIMD